MAAAAIFLVTSFGFQTAARKEPDGGGRHGGVPEDGEGRAVRTVAELSDGDRVRVWVADGRFDADVAGSPSKLAKERPGKHQEDA